MTNSFRPQAQPVDTFVRPSTVAPTTGFDQLVNALKTVNPSINQYFDSRIKDEIENEQQEGAELAIEESVKGFKNITKSVRKKDGDDAARQLIGGSIFADRAYQRTKANILGNNIKSRLENSYATTQINDQPLSAYKFESQEFQGWLEEQRNTTIDLLGDVNSTYVNKYFIPKLTDATANITGHHIKQYKEFKFEELKSLSTPLVSQVIALDTDSAKELIQGYEISMGDLGISGKDRQAINKAIVDAIMAEAETVGIDGDEEKAEEILELAGLFPYGPGGKLSLLEHPDFKEKANQLERRLADMSWKNAQRDEIEKKRAKEDDVVNSLKTYAEALNNDDPNANKILDDLILRQPDKAAKIQTNQSALDGDTRERYAELQTQTLDGSFNSEGDAAIAALDWFQDPRTPKTAENIRRFNDLIRYANQVGNGEFTEVNKYISEFSSLVNSRLRANKSTFNIMGQVTGEGAKIEGKYKNLFSDSLRRWKFNNPDASQEEIFNKFTELRDKYDKQLLNSLNNPFGNQVNNQVNNQTDGPPRPKTQKDEIGAQRTESTEEELPGVEEVSPLGNQSSNPITNAANQIANALTGTGPAAAGTLEEAKERGELKPVSRQQSLRDGAAELGVKPEDLAAIISYETIGSFDPQIVGTDKNTGDTYQGLIQFGPWERENYNITTDMSFQDQMKAAVQFLKDRGVKPGHGPKEMYAAVLTGHVANIEKGGLNWVDANGTTVNKALKDLLPGGGHYEKGVQFLQQQS